jgi:hypothetical protein
VNHTPVYYFIPLASSYAHFERKEAAEKGQQADARRGSMAVNLVGYLQRKAEETEQEMLRIAEKIEADARAHTLLVEGLFEAIVDDVMAQEVRRYYVAVVEDERQRQVRLALANEVGADLIEQELQWCLFQTAKAGIAATSQRLNDSSTQTVRVELHSMAQASDEEYGSDERGHDYDYYYGEEEEEEEDAWAVSSGDEQEEEEEEEDGADSDGSGWNVSVNGDASADDEDEDASWIVSDDEGGLDVNVSRNRTDRTVSATTAAELSAFMVGSSSGRGNSKDDDPAVTAHALPSMCSPVSGLPPTSAVVAREAGAGASKPLPASAPPQVGARVALVGANEEVGHLTTAALGIQKRLFGTVLQSDSALVGGVGFGGGAPPPAAASSGMNAMSPVPAPSARREMSAVDMRDK